MGPENLRYLGLYAKILDLALFGKLTLLYYPKCVHKSRNRIEEVLYDCTMISLLAMTSFLPPAFLRL